MVPNFIVISYITLEITTHTTRYTILNNIKICN